MQIRVLLGDVKSGKDGISSKRKQRFPQLNQTWSFLIFPQLIGQRNTTAQQFVHRPYIPWKILFPQTLWNIWLQWNKAIFQDRNVERGLSALCSKKSVEFYAIMPNNPSKSSRIQVHVKWSKPHPGWVKLNTDGLVFGDPKKAGGGEIIRNNEGDWVVRL